MTVFKLTVVLSRADLAAPSRLEDGVGAVGRRALGLDVLAANAAHDPALLVELEKKKRGKEGLNSFLKCYGIYGVVNFLF